MSSARVGVFGGTFDPPHIGHLIVARDAVDALKLDRLIWVPAGLPPHKDGAGVTPAAIRCEMVREVVEEDERFGMSDVEVTRRGPSFTVDTLRHFRERNPGASLFLLVGADQFAEMASWREAEEVARLARVAVFPRGGSDPRGVDRGAGMEGEIVPVLRIDLSSSEVRGRAAAGRPIRGLVPEGVRRIILRRGLYQAGRPARG